MSDVVFVCPACGPGVGADEDECCTVCGSQVFSSDAPWYVAALAAARAEEREACAKEARTWITETHVCSTWREPDGDCACDVNAPDAIADAIRAGGGT